MSIANDKYVIINLDDQEPGEYVLGFRWDCEQLPQIYSSCSTIILVLWLSVDNVMLHEFIFILQLKYY